MPTSPGDYFAPFANVTIIRGEKRIPLWMQPDPHAVSPDLPYLQEVNVKMHLGGIPVITAKLAPPYRNAIAFLGSELVEWGGGAELEVILGYASGGNGRPVFTTPYRGLLLKPDISVGDDISVTLNAQGINPSPLTSTSGKTYRGTRQTIITDILRGQDQQNPRRTRVDAAEVKVAGNPVLQEFTKDQIEVTSGGRSDWSVIHELLWEIGCWALWHGDTLKVIPRTFRLQAAPKYILTTYDYPAGEIGLGDVPVIPMRSASSPSMGIYLPQAALGIRQAGVNPQTRQAENRVTNERSVAPARTGPGAAGPRASPNSPQPTAQGEGAAYFPGAPADQLAQQQAREEYAAMTGTVGAKLNAETLGLVELFPGDIFAVRGLGRRLETNFALLVMEHNFSYSGFVTKLEMHSNVDTITGEEARRQCLGPTNRHQPSRPATQGWSANDAREFLAATSPQPQQRTRSRTARSRGQTRSPTRRQAPGTLSNTQYAAVLNDLGGL